MLGGYYLLFGGELDEKIDLTMRGAVIDYFQY